MKAPFRPNFDCPICGHRKGKGFNHEACSKKLKKQHQSNKPEKKNETNASSKC